MAQTRAPRTSRRTFPRRGDVYDTEMDPVVGSEIGKRRPAVVVSNNLNNAYSSTVTVVPITGQPASRAYPFEVQIPRGVAGLTVDSRAKTDQIRAVDKRRLLNYRGAVPPEYLARLERALKIHLDLK